MNRFGKFLLIFIVALFIFGAVGFIVAFSLRDSGYSFYVEYNGNKYFGGSTSNEGIYVFPNTEHKFVVKSIASDNVDYTVKVLSNSVNNFNFGVDDTMYSFYNGDDELDDYSAIFDLQQTDGGFTIFVPQGMTVQSAIEAKYGGEAIFFDSFSSDKSYFKLCILIDNVTIELPLYLISFFEISPSGVIFY